MNLLTNWLETPVAGALARTLLHSLWEGAAVGVALAAALWVLRSSRARYGAACVAMLILAGGLAITLARFMPERANKATGVITGVARPLPLAKVATGSLANPARPDPLPWVVPFWIAGVLVFYLRGLMGWMAARRVRTTGVCPAPELWRMRMDHLRDRLRVTRPVVLLESCMAEVPVVIGYLRPVILVPVGLLAGLPAGQVEAILLHELAHIRRFDYLVNLLQVFVEGLLFYHPAVWWISRAMRQERENCCDDLVVSVTGGALEYAAALTALEGIRVPSPALAATDGGLVRRVRRLLGMPEQRYAGVMPAIVAGALTATVTATAMLAMSTLQSGSAVRSTPRVAALPDSKTAVVQEPRLLAQAPNNGQSTPAAAPQPRDAAASRAETASTLQPDRILYERAIHDNEIGNYVAARLTLNALINNYVTSEYLAKAKLAIADSWYQQAGTQGLAQAESEYKDFVLFYPNMTEATEAKYRICDIQYQRSGRTNTQQLEQCRQSVAQTAPMNKLAQYNEQYSAQMRQQTDDAAKLDEMKKALQSVQSAVGYQKWLNGDVVYIISDEERKAFQQLNTDEERGKFVEQFWLRRDPTPGTPENEFKEEIYRRIAYANEHFASNVPGWKTDRGRIYIQYGPPDEVEAHPSGGTFLRPAEQGGGAIKAYPFEQWRYRFIEGVGQNVIVEFVDSEGKGDYRMTMDPSVKDALVKPAR
jgi:GWxTD domain-containing protein